MIWKDIKGFEGLYQVSTYGRVRSVNRIIKYSDGRIREYPEVELIPSIGTNGYFGVSLHVNNKKNRREIHRLVAESFLENPEGKLEVNHINGFKLNNKVNNLEWSSRQENMNHAISTGLHNQKGENHSQVKLSNDDVFWIRERYKAGYKPKTIAEIYSVSDGHIREIVKGNKR